MSELLDVLYSFNFNLENIMLPVDGKGTIQDSMEIKGRVLIAEDNDAIRKLLEKLLTGNNYIVDAVDNGLDAKEKLRSKNYDMLLSDILMPGLNGIELLKEVRDNFGDIPVVLITGNQSLENAREAIHWGAFDYITKPFDDLSEILNSVFRAVSKGRLQKEKENLINELDRKNVHLKNVVRELDRKNARLDLLVYDLEWAMKLGRIMTQEMDSDKFLEKMTPGIFEIFDTSEWGVLLYNQGKDPELIIFRTRKSEKDNVSDIMTEVLYEFEKSTSKKVHTKDLKLSVIDKIMSNSALSDKKFYPSVLKVGEQILGLVFVYAEIKEDFERSKMHAFSLIASQLSGALETTSLFNQLIERNRELKELSDFKDEILGIAAHDLRSPISAISISATLLKDYADKMTPEEVRETIEGIVVKSAHMTKMLNEMLDISVIESGNLVLKKSIAKLKVIIDNQIRQVLPLAHSKNIELLFEVPENLPDLNIDINKISEVLNNLLTNAIKYTQSGGIVRLSVKSERKNVEICVEDTGVGIKENELKKLFKKFSRTSAKPTAGESSTGLGLSISKKIVEMHNGKIWAESVIGKGSKFYFTIPAE